MSKPKREKIYLDVRKDSQGSFIGDQNLREVANVVSFKTTHDDFGKNTTVELAELKMVKHAPIQPVSPAKSTSINTPTALSDSEVAVEEVHLGKQRVVRMVVAKGAEIQHEQLQMAALQLKKSLGKDTVVVFSHEGVIDYEFFELERNELPPSLSLSDRAKKADWNF